MTRPILFATVCLLLALPLSAQDRDTKVRNDRKQFEEAEDWIYNDLGKALAAAKEQGKPLLAVIRCVPCENCKGFDAEVASRNKTIRDLMEKFVCVRIVQGNALDLSLFQYDYDLSFAVMMLNADKVVYGRFGTRTSRDETHEDITMDGFRKALLGALELHQAYPGNRELFKDKRGPAPRFKVPEEYPTLTKYKPTLDYDGKVAQSCIHCHQIRDAERAFVRSTKQTIPDEVLFPYPMPDVVGFSLDASHKAKVTSVAKESAAEKAGLAVGDEILSLAGQPLLSIADVQYVLHHAKSPDSLEAEVMRGDKTLKLTLALAEGWRRTSDISWRATTWELRRMGAGGLKLDELTGEERQKAGLPEAELALLVKHVGQYGPHAAGKNAGFQKGDILISIDGRNERLTESTFLAYALQQKKPGEQMAVTVLRGGKKVELKLPTQ